jgi:2-methylisocitrate lyase-like PEP mutase family enzyme
MASYMAQLVEAGVQRAGLGGRITWAALHAAASTLEAIQRSGDFSGWRPRPALPDWFR